MPNRLIRESICTSRTISSLSWFEEVFYYRLWVNCDDYGRMHAELRILRAKLFPMVDVALDDIEKALQRLVELESVRLYESDGREYLEICNWSRYQQIRAKRSKYPEPSSAQA